ncbi:MAG: putative toxin-antitoxin system toxin component, PIN family [Deferrisomatales bacterium]|nr:putative toxin-antitoxin system toxin component, PIN family [Deferrisomatales bacterium]
MSTVPRVVLDTNLVLSALVFSGGRVAELRRAWQQGASTPLVSRDTAAELVRVLAYPKFRLSREEQEVLLADYLPHADTVKIPARKPRVPPCRDPFDAPFLLLAVAGEADFLVTGDQDLLSLDGQIPGPIVTADAFLQTLSSAGKGEPA